MSGNLRPREKDSICALVGLLRLTDYPGIEEPEWIDGAVKGDALPEARANPFLIEHFTIDSTPDQRKLGAQFMKLVGGLKQKFATVSFSLTIAMPDDIAQTGRDWERQRHALASWINDVAPTLSDGHHRDVHVPGFAADFHIWKNCAAPRPGVIFKRWPSKESGLVERLRNDVLRKASKLAVHKREDEHSLLLVESDDIALMNAHEFLGALRTAFPTGVSGVDAIWFCHTLTECQSNFLNVGTGDLYLFDRLRGTVVWMTRITV
ncbi:MAG: hypothetical protein SFW09_08620 [Hyphomicrobiaceae bacterium]|nr:hypothetical protein [Hyphomicrobiaceae bacterium]